MKHTLFILALITATIQTFAQSPRIKLNQITKDSLTGSVLISSPTDSGMVYSRDLFISYGADTVLILGGDTLAATSSIISSVLSDGVTITGDGTIGSELTVDTATVIATKQDLDLYYLDSNPNGYTSNTGTVTSVGGTGTVNGISLSGTVTSSGDLTLGGTLSGVDLASQITGTLPIANGGTGSATQNFVDLSTTQTVGGAKTFTSALNQSGGDVNFDSGTFFVDNNNNAVAFGGTDIADFGAGFKTVVQVNANYAGTNSFRLFNTSTDTTSRIGLTLHNGATGVEAIGINLTGQNYNGVADWGDRFVVQTGSGIANGVLFYADQGGIQFNSSFPTTTRDLYIEQTTGNIFMGNLDDTTTVSANVYYNTTSKELMYTTSSQRYKKNIQDYDKGINDLMKLRPVYYQSKKSNDLSKFGVGFIAEEVEEAGFNEYIDYDSDGLANSVHYSLMTAILTKAIQEQQAIIETQATEIEQLKSQIQLILSEIEQIKNN